jgi:hypothetical protein
MDLPQTTALSDLAVGLNRLFDEAVEMLPRMIEAEKANEPLPQRDPLTITNICDALSFVENGRPKFLTLAHLDDGKISYRMQEVLVWVALETATCRAIEEKVHGVKRVRGGLLQRFRSQPQQGSEPTLEKSYNHAIMGKTQNTAIRAAFLANFVRFSIDHIASSEPAKVLEPSVERAQRYFNAYQIDIERLAPHFADTPAAASLLKSMSFPMLPIIIADLEGTNCEKLNGVPMKLEHFVAWRNRFADMQGSPAI